MAINLITGHSGSNHISSADARAMNRATYGNGNYRLYAENGSNPLMAGCSVGKNTQSGTYRPNVGKGVIMWNGMFIRVDATVNHTEYLESLSGLKIYLHYQKVSNVESVEFVFTFDDSAFASKIKANWEFTDSLTDVYVLYYTFTNATGSSGTYSFAMKKAATDLIEEEVSTRASAISSLTTIVNGKVNTSTYNTDQAAVQTKIDQKVSLKPFSTASDGTSYDRKYLGYITLIPQTSASSTGTTITATLNETIENFAFIDVRVGGSGYFNSVGVIPTFMLKSVSASSAWGGSSSIMKCISKWLSSTGLYEIYTGLYINGTTVYGYPYKQYNNGTFAAGTSNKAIYFYGVGRVAS